MALGSSGPVETKVYSSAAGAALSTLLIWVLNNYLLPEVMPPTIEAAVTVLVVSATTFFSGFLTAHTWRSDADAFTSPPGRHATPDEVPPG